MDLECEARNGERCTFWRDAINGNRVPDFRTIIKLTKNGEAGEVF